MKRVTRLQLVALMAALSLATFANARVELAATAFRETDFRGAEKITATCSTQTPSFFCEDGQDLTLITSKGVDFIFDGSGQLVAAYGKQQRGQRMGDYTIDARFNLIPFESQVPGLALLVDGQYTAPTQVRGSWREGDEGLLVGTFTAVVGGFSVERTLTLQSGVDTIGVELTVRRLEGADAPSTLQVVVPGIGRTAAPVVKIGHGESFTLNPSEQAYPDPTYASLQMNNNNRDFALVMRPAVGATGVSATYMRPNRIAFQAEVGASVGASYTFDLGLYPGHNELVRYSQEHYLELPGLFNPNILGRLSLIVVRILEFVHQYVPSWGLSIIVLTLLFRALIWPLISTQTRSMFGMQRLQPKLQELQKKYKEDREKLTQETMALYREAGVNPAGGCLPVIVQMPLFIILWRVFVNFEFNEGFLWLPDLGQADPFYILPILYVAVMVATSYFSARGNPQMLRQSLIINVVFVFIIVGFPAGVLVYYVVSMLVQVIQYWLLSRGQPAPVAAAPAKRSK